MKPLYHLIQQADLEQLKTSERYEPDSLALDGFIHLAYKEQLPFIIQQFFVPPFLKAGVLNKGEGLQQVGLYLVEITPERLTAKVVDEPAVGLSTDLAASTESDSLEQDRSPERNKATELYPHLYGALNREAIVTINSLHINALGDYVISGL
ncbi:DUF952 domain-containing protein [uncultured Shewanella sp.]|uniref:DUF952 domain-containing protein n=1 Tax=uncultured Shewanella sp. TaxID=173975 RepID=UPI00261D6FA3|nr:DUF952 domain-containing protein [uncultured Shewanella sp.]